MQSTDRVDTSVEDADHWDLARNPTYVQMQKKLIERTVERNRLRCVAECTPLLHKAQMPFFAKGLHI